MSRFDNQIWQMTTPMPAGQQLQTYRSQKIGKNSRKLIPVSDEDKGALAIFMQMVCDNSAGKDILMLGHSRSKKTDAPAIPYELFCLILTFNFGMTGCSVEERMEQIGTEALILKSRQSKLPKSILLFPPHILGIDHVIEAVLHGDEAMLINMLKTNPDLTQKGEGIDFSGREFTKEKDTALTPLQAAIACADFAPNKNSTGLCELIVEKLKEQYPDNWHVIVEEQTLELYIKSLRFYAKKQAEKIHGLYQSIGEGEEIDMAVVTAEEKRLEAYDRALHTKDLKTIIKAHTNPDPDPANTKAADAQKDHVIQQVDQALLNAMAAATDAEIQAVLDDPTIDSPLSNLLKKFRDDFTKLSHEEIIFNPQHLLKMFLAYDTFYNLVANTDPHYKKRELFWCHLVGFVQRYLPANIAQVFADPGLYDTVENAAKNSRGFDFKYGGDSIFPLSFNPSSNSGVGYKFTPGPAGADVARLVGRGAGGFTKLMSSKNSKLSELVTQPIERAHKSGCVVS